jgi:hypothetical protein
MSYPSHPYFSPIFAHPHYDSGNTQSDATIEYEAAQREKNHADALLQQSVNLNDTIRQKQKELEQIHKNQGFAITTDMNANQDRILDDILFSEQQLTKVDEELPRAQYVVNARAAQIEALNRDQRQQVAAAAAAAAAAKDAAINADRRKKIGNARDMYDKELQQYNDAVRYVNVHEPKGWGWASFLPSFPFGSKIPEWQLTGDENETEINRKESLLNAEITRYYNAHPILKGIPVETLQAVRPQPPPRAKSPPPQGGGGKSKRRTKKGKGKNARPCRRSTCRRSTCRRSTRRH